MEIETGEHFVVKHGEEIGTTILGVSPAQMMQTMQSGELPGSAELKPRYDKAHDGLVYKALAVCNDMVAVEVVYDSFGPLYRGESYVGKRFSMNTEGLELWPVTELYANELKAAWEKEKHKYEIDNKLANELATGMLAKLYNLPDLGKNTDPSQSKFQQLDNKKNLNEQGKVNKSPFPDYDDVSDENLEDF